MILSINCDNSFENSQGNTAVPESTRTGNHSFGKAQSFSTFIEGEGSPMLFQTRVTRCIAVVAVSATAFMSYAAYTKPQGAVARAGENVHAYVRGLFDSGNTETAHNGRGAVPALAYAAQAGGRRLAPERDALKSPSMERQVFGEHIRQKSSDPSRRMPHQSPISRVVESGYDHSSARTNVLNRPSILMQYKSGQISLRANAAAACDANAFGSLSGSALVAAVKSATTECINDLFNVSGSSAYNTFREAQMVTIANALYGSAASYDGTNSGSTLQLILFLRAGYYVQFYDTSVGTYGTALKNAIRPAMDAFAGSSYFGVVNDTHGEILAEYVTLIDSSTENARYLYVVKRLLDAYNSSYNAFYWMKVAVNNTFLVTFRGHQNADFKALVQSDTSIVDTLYNFASRNFSMLGQSNDYLVANAGRELARFLQYTGAVKSLAQSRSKALGDRSSITGTTAKMWVGIAEMVDYYDKANCAYYSMCDLANRLKAAVLPITHTCSSTLTIRAQSMTAAQLSSTCSIVGGQESYFHQQLATARVPVANDNNAALEMVVFDSSNDYGTYAGAIYGIDTNNGGMYLEGNPAVAGNQARFIAYEAEWMLPAFEIWNLTHEYVHYLDGRFNMYGDFGATISQKTIWWVEGLAEYMSYSYRQLAYTAAQDQAALGTYSLSTIYQNDYGSGQTRVYNWGYLAVRFMFEQRRPQVNSILGYFRPGNYTGYASFMSSVGTTNNSTFAAWLPCVAKPSSPGCGTPTNLPPTANFNFTANALTVAFADTSTDADGTIASRSWNFGDGTTSTTANPSKTYAAPGTYAVQLTVTDNAGATATRTQSVTVSGGGNTTSLSNGVAKTGLGAAASASLNFTMDVPAGASGLKFVMTGGTGDADMYVRFGSVPTSTTYDCRPYATGNNETCTIATTQAGRYYVTLTAYTAFSGVSLTGSYSGGTSNQLPTANFSFTSNGLTANFTDSSTDSDGTIASRSWSFGDGTTSTAANPGKTYASTGTYTVSLTATDNAGGKSTVSKSVTVTSGDTSLPECSGTDARQLDKNCSRSNLSATSGNHVSMYILVPSGVTQLKITAAGGTGNADLYVNTLGNWATNTNYNYSSRNAGNSETVTVPNPPAGYVYISLYGATNFNGVKVSTQY